MTNAMAATIRIWERKAERRAERRTWNTRASERRIRAGRVDRERVAAAIWAEECDEAWTKTQFGTDHPA